MKPVIKTQNVMKGGIVELMAVAHQIDAQIAVISRHAITDVMTHQLSVLLIFVKAINVNPVHHILITNATKEMFIGIILVIK